MKHVLLFLGLGAGLAACSSNTDQASTTKRTANASDGFAVNTPSATPTTAEQPEDALDRDSAMAANATAVARQPQVDTSVNKIGTGPVGSAGGKGAQLIAGADCASCHREREKLLGPAYHDVALKYPTTPANVAMLAKKVITGGKGVWGDIAMTPHPGLSENDSKEMVRYVLSLK